ncbi:MAG: hypothetical protein CMN30_26500 [Sandaracinus sp.]|nr:hypothetical protein [Sandaracinus sp.]
MVKPFRALALAPLLTFALACGDDGGGDGPACASSVDCDEGICIDGTCQVPDRPDAGPVRDAAPGEDMEPVDPDLGPDEPEDMGPPDMPPVDMGPGSTTDSDGDGISDLDEGATRPTPNDTDGDGTPDYLDEDSDDDGIPDMVEAGDTSISTPPVDSDFDGTPDYRDRDSDDNGVRDAIEGAGDADGDSILDYRDRDNDNDFLDDLLELAGMPASPPDHDGDGTPDYMDVDSDGDTIGDAYEEAADTDRDGTPDRFDLDTDGDGWTDAQEAGDADVLTPPVDTDGDGRPDFRDLDSDNDGLSDAAERTAGTSRTHADTDGDGVTDVVEVGAGTDPLNGSDNPRARGDFVFVVPYMGAPDPTRDTLQFATTLRKADVYFLVDTTGSMGGEIAALRSSLSGTIIPQVRARIADAWFGVGGFEDYPVGSWGGSGDIPFYQQSTMSSSVTTAQNAVNGLALGYGGDYPESLVPAIWSLATGTQIPYGQARPSCPAGRLGFACFRSDAVPVIVVITDAISHNYTPAAGDSFWATQGFTINYSGVSGPPPTYAQAITALNDLGARVVGISSQGSTPAGWQPRVRDMLLAISADTDTRDAGGSSAPFFFQIGADGTGLSTSVVDAIENAAEVPIDVSARAVDVVEPGETVDAVAAFVDFLETRVTAAPGLSCTTGFSVVDRPGIDADSVPDTFQAVPPGQPVCFDIIPKMNTTVMPTSMPQVFRARIDVLGDGFTPLDDREVYFLVPPVVTQDG